jgi:4'-phosphopantetheinyl transferase EntD
VASGGIPAWPLSIAHSRRAAVAVLSFNPRITVGVDIVELQPLSDGVLRAWFTADEQQWLAAAEPRERLVAWALKEAIFKALNQGEAFAPQRIAVRRNADRHYTASWNGAPLDGVCQLQTWEQDGHLLALAAASARRSA